MPNFKNAFILKRLLSSYCNICKISFPSDIFDIMPPPMSNVKNNFNSEIVLCFQIIAHMNCILMY